MAPPEDPGDLPGANGRGAAPGEKPVPAASSRWEIRVMPLAAQRAKNCSRKKASAPDSASAATAVAYVVGV